MHEVMSTKQRRVKSLCRQNQVKRRLTVYIDVETSQNLKRVVVSVSLLSDLSSLQDATTYRTLRCAT
jgi:hypothetical protein